MVLIIDGNHIAARCYYGVDLLSTSNGKSVNVIYGFLNVLKSYVRRYGLENNCFIVTWDGEGRKERAELDSNYKANRKRFPEEYYIQINDVKKILGFLSIQQFCLKHVEADDIIGTITRISRKKGKKVLIISSDHDFEQLISKHVHVLSPSLSIAKEFFKDSRYVFLKYEIEKPKQLIEVMALTGDETDNVFGLPRVGMKTAVNLLKANGGLDKILENHDSLKMFNKKGDLKDATETIKVKVSENIDRIKLNKSLVTINCFLDISVNFNGVQKVNIEGLKNSFEELEFKKFLKELDQWQKIFGN